MAIGFVLITTKPGQEKVVREKLEQIDYASGTCLFTSTLLIKKIGFLSLPHFFSLWE